MCSAPSPAPNKTEGYWYYVAGIHFYDGSEDMTLQEFAKAYVSNFEGVVGKAASFKTKLTNYFHDLIEKIKD